MERHSCPCIYLYRERYNEANNVAMYNNVNLSYSTVLTSVRGHSNSVSSTSVDGEQLGHHTGIVSADSHAGEGSRGRYILTLNRVILCV